MSPVRLFRALGLTLATFVASACSDHSTAPPPTPRAAIDVLPVSPSSVGWQAQARVLIAANNMSPLAAGRVLAALSVAQYRAVKAISDPIGDGQLPADGIGADGRSAPHAGSARAVG